MAAVFPAFQVIEVGGGLAGMSAANQAVECGGQTVLLDKSSYCGGNSTKATSGINGAGTKTQKAKGSPDNAEIFTADTLMGGAKRPELAKVLCVNSAADVDWLDNRRAERVAFRVCYSALGARRLPFWLKSNFGSSHFGSRPVPA